MHSQIWLAAGDTWNGGEVSGASTAQQQGAVECAAACTLVNMWVHDNPGAFAGIYVHATTGVSVSGGEVARNGSLGIGGAGAINMLVSGVQIDHNGASASCGFEGGGFKGVNPGLRFTNNYVHDNNCPGVWLDIDASNVEIDHNRIDHNFGEGIFYEISHDAVIHDNEVSGNGFGTSGGGCPWLWGAGIGIASSYNVQVYGNTLNGNCNGIGGTQQNRGTDSSGHPRVLQNVSVHNNTINGGGRSGAAADNGANLTTRNIVFVNNSYGGGDVFCGVTC